jgi:hypothetical protein
MNILQSCAYNTCLTVFTKKIKKSLPVLLWLYIVLNLLTKLLEENKSDSSPKISWNPRPSY